MFSWCCHWGLQPADAEDLTQALLYQMVAQAKVSRYDPEKGSFRAWLKTLTRHAWYDFAKKQHQKAMAEGGSEVLQRLCEVPARDDLLHRLAEAFDLEMLELAKNRVIERVAPHTWEAFRLSEEEGLSIEQVAEQTNIRPAMVYVARSKVRQMLKEELERLEQEDNQRENE